MKFLRCDDGQKWNQFIETSCQGTVFARSECLSCYGVPQLYWVEEDGRPLLGASLLLDKSGAILSPDHTLSLYVGLYVSSSLEQLVPHKKTKKLLEVIELMMESLSTLHNHLVFVLHPSFPDLRGLQWFNYHAPEKGKFDISLRYTGIVSLEDMDREKYLTSIRSVKRYEYKQAKDAGYKVVSTKDVALLNRIHETTFARQGLQRTESEVAEMEKLATAAVSEGWGQIFICETPEGKPASATLFLYDSTTGYYLVGANDPEYRKSGAGTFLVLENIFYCLEKGLKKIDFIGINSPNRGDYKTSLGGVPVPYFYAEWKKP
ncbi:MAG: GNAT family N-acetyltransferase [Verrucomicrobiota bacterium]|nr:GNAT family N-acetyltransferase [Verrucomicrobiota bacterium]